MSEHGYPVERSPEARMDALAKYLRLMVDMKKNGPETARRVWTDATLEINELLALSPESKDISKVQSENLHTRIMPGEYHPMEWTSFEEWRRQLQLAPMRLLYMELPRIEELTSPYLMEAYRIGLLGETEHCYECMSTDDPLLTRCETSLACPALVSRAVGQRLLGLLHINAATSQLTGDYVRIATDTELIGTTESLLIHFRLMRLDELYDYRDVCGDAVQRYFGWDEVGS